MDWSEEEIARGVDAFAGVGLSRDSGGSPLHREVAAVMTRAVELYLARLTPSGQVAEDRDGWLCAKVALHLPDVADELSRRRAADAQEREQAESSLAAFKNAMAESEQATSKELKRLEGDRRSALASREHAERERGEARQDRDAALAELSGMKQRLIQCESALERANKEADTYQQERDTARQEAEALRAQLADLRVDLAEAKEDRDSWHRKADALQERVAEAAKALEAAIDQERRYRDQRIKEERIRARNQGRTAGITEAMAVCNEEGQPVLAACVRDLLEESES